MWCDKSLGAHSFATFITRILVAFLMCTQSEMNASLTPNFQVSVVLCIVFNKKRTACMMNVGTVWKSCPRQSSGTEAKVQEKHVVENSDCLQPKLHASGPELFLKYFCTLHENNKNRNNEFSMLHR